MVHIGNTPASNFASVTKDTFSGDGSTTAFTLSKAATTNGVAVFVENVRQEPTTAYAVSGTTLTFTAAPVSASGNNIYVLHHNTPASTATHPAGQDLTAANSTMTGTLAVTGTSTLTGNVALGGTLDMNGAELVLDADADSSIHSSTDDQIDIKVGGSDTAIVAADSLKIRSDNAGLIFRRTTSETDIAKIQYVNGNPSLDIGADGKNIRFVNQGSYAESMRIKSNGHVGIGTTNPGNFFEAIGNVSGGYAGFLHNDGNSNGHYGLRVAAGLDDRSTSNVIISMCDGDNEAQGHITISGSTVSYGAFTAHHEISLPNADNANGYAYGTLLDIDKIYYTQKNGKDSERGIRYLVKKTQGAYSRKVLGAYSADMFQQADKDILYTEDDTIPEGKKVGDVKIDGGTYKGNLHQAGVLGDGHVICNGEKGNIVVGDGICSSSTAGVGMKADKMAMIIGIAQEDVTFSSASETKLVPVQYGVRQFTPWTD